MGTQNDHGAKYLHLFHDIDRHSDHIASLSPLPSASFVQDILYAACHRLDFYLALLCCHPQDRAEREAALTQLSHLNKGFDHLINTYQEIADAADLAEAGGAAVTAGQFATLKQNLADLWGQLNIIPFK